MTEWKSLTWSVWAPAPGSSDQVIFCAAPLCPLGSSKLQSTWCRAPSMGVKVLCPSSSYSAFQLRGLEMLHAPFISNLNVTQTCLCFSFLFWFWLRSMSHRMKVKSICICNFWCALGLLYVLCWAKGMSSHELGEILKRKKPWYLGQGLLSCINLHQRPEASGPPRSRSEAFTSLQPGSAKGNVQKCALPRN